MEGIDIIDIDAVIPLFEQYNVKKAAVFGSIARGEAHLSSDIDILITFGGKYDLWDIIGLKQDLETVFNRPVDLLTFKSLRDDSFSTNVLAEAKLIYEKN